MAFYPPKLPQTPHNPSEAGGQHSALRNHPRPHDAAAFQDDVVAGHADEFVDVLIERGQTAPDLFSYH